METTATLLKTKVIPSIQNEEVKIFIVNNDTTYLYSLGFYLKKYTKSKVYCYTNGDECLRNMPLKPSIVILDYFFNPAKSNATDSLQMLKQIKNSNPETKVVMLSGKEYFEDVINSARLETFMHIPKDTQTLYSIKEIINSLCFGNHNF